MSDEPNYQLIHADPTVTFQWDAKRTALLVGGHGLAVIGHLNGKIVTSGSVQVTVKGVGVEWAQAHDSSTQDLECVYFDAHCCDSATQRIANPDLMAHLCGPHAKQIIEGKARERDKEPNCKQYDLIHADSDVHFQWDEEWETLLVGGHGRCVLGNVRSHLKTFGSVELVANRVHGEAHACHTSSQRITVVDSHAYSRDRSYQEMGSAATAESSDASRQVCGIVEGEACCENHSEQFVGHRCENAFCLHEGRQTLGSVEGVAFCHHNAVQEAQSVSSDAYCDPQDGDDDWWETHKSPFAELVWDSGSFGEVVCGNRSRQTIHGDVGGDADCANGGCQSIGGHVGGDASVAILAKQTLGSVAGDATCHTSIQAVHGEVGGDATCTSGRQRLGSVQGDLQQPPFLDPTSVEQVVFGDVGGVAGASGGVQRIMGSVGDTVQALSHKPPQTSRQFIGGDAEFVNSECSFVVVGGNVQIKDSGCSGKDAVFVVKGKRTARGQLR
jgi:hypothetical protein